MNTARTYGPVRPGAGMLMLADRRWPRGIPEDDPRAGRWLKNVAPSSEVRHWYSHDPAKFVEFARRYTIELEEPAAAAAPDELKAVVAVGPVMLKPAASELDVSHLAVLVPLLEAGR